MIKVISLIGLKNSIMLIKDKDLLFQEIKESIYKRLSLKKRKIFKLRQY